MHFIASQAQDMQPFLRSTEVIDWRHPDVMAQAHALAASESPLETARSCFEWVRDEVPHSYDAQRNPITCRASDVLNHRTGYCFAKSHLMAALLRANGIPAGFCYQRLSLNDDGPPYTLHGFNAVYLPDHGWYRVDARGNKPGVAAQFTPPVEQLAFSAQAAGEAEFAEILPDPLACVVEALGRVTTWDQALAALPDVDLRQAASIGLSVRSD